MVIAIVPPHGTRQIYRPGPGVFRPLWISTSSLRLPSKAEDHQFSAGAAGYQLNLQEVGITIRPYTLFFFFLSLFSFSLLSFSPFLFFCSFFLLFFFFFLIIILLLISSSQGAISPTINTARLDNNHCRIKRQDLAMLKM